MPDDRFDPEVPGARVSITDRVLDLDPDRWSPDDVAWVRARVQEALDDPRPALSEEQMDCMLDEQMRELEAKYGS